MKHQRKWAAWILTMVMLLCIALSVPVQAAPEGETFIVNNSGFPETIRQFTSSLGLEPGETLQVTSDGIRLTGSDLIATGQQVTIYSVDGAVIHQGILVVMGDVLGTGTASIAQIVRMSQALNGSDPLTGAFAQAGDLSGNGSIDLMDIVAVSKQLEEVMRTDNVQIDAREVTYYIFSSDNQDIMELYFMNGNQDVPYIACSDLMDLLNKLYIMDNDTAHLSLESSGQILQLVRETGSSAELNFANNTISFDDFNAFFKATYASTILDVLTSNYSAESDGEQYYDRVPGSFERFGRPITIDLTPYNIQLVYANGEGYLPLQTASDIFFSTKTTPIGWNGEFFAVLGGGALLDLEDLYYSVPTGQRSAELAQFSYDELCLSLDLFYGLKEQHNFTTFDNLFEQTGLKPMLLSPDPLTVDNALYELCDGYFADLHSRFGKPSPLAGKNAQVTSDNISSAYADMIASIRRFSAARAEYYPDGMPSYEEVGDTAYIAFDAFEAGETDYYTNPPGPDAEDTLGIIMYAHSQITREDSPIENVVLDLSVNGGGDADAAVFVLGWLLGNNARVDINDTLTNAQASTRYLVDVNADGKFDVADTLGNRKIYCLISPTSFSCGNLVPAVLSASRQVTMVGQRTAGGACVVRPVSTADGSLLRISGSWRVSTMTNGSYYDVDRGVEPNIYISDPAHYYDRAVLTEYLKNIFR